MKAAILIAAVLATASAPVLAGAAECRIRIEQVVKDDVGNTWQPGKVLPVDIQGEEPKRISFCAHGGSCIPQMLNLSVASRLLGCRKGKSLGDGDYALVHEQRAPLATLTPFATGPDRITVDRKVGIDQHIFDSGLAVSAMMLSLKKSRGSLRRTAKPGC